MNNYEAMTRDELLSALRELAADRDQALRPAHEDCPRFPVCGELEQREFDASPWPIRIFDRKTMKYLAVNDAALKLYGYTREEFLRLTPFDNRHPEERSAFYATLAEPTGYLRHRGPRRHVRKSGETIIVEIVTQDVLYKGREARLSLTIDVTERVRMEDALRRREQEFSALVGNSTDIIVRFDRDLRYVYVNPAGSAVMRIPRKALIGKTSREAGVPESLVTIWDREVRRVFDTGQEGRVEFECPCHSEVMHFEARMVPEFGPDGAIETVLTTSRDITERKRAEEELQRQKKLLNAVIEHLPVGVVLKDARTLRYLMRNRAAENLTGLGSAEAINKRADDVYPPDLAAIFNEADRKALVRGAAVPVSMKALQYRTGRIARHLRVPVPDETGQYTHLVTIIEDLTDIEAAQSALRRSEERLKQLISMSPASIFSLSLDPPFATTFISENLTAQVGCRASDFTSDPSFWSDRIHPGDRAAAFKELAKITTEGKYACEYRFRHKDGSWRWMHDEARVVRDAGGIPREAIGILMDITARRLEAEERLERAVRQRDVLVREVHHRIKNHLQGIAGLLREKAHLHPAAASLIDATVGQMHSVALAYGLQEDAGSPVMLSQLLDSICASVEGLCAARVNRQRESGKAASLRLAASQAVPVALAINELMYNAVKHHAGGDGPRVIDVSLTEREHKAEVRIANRGSLPAGFDYATDAGCGTGLDLVKTLLGPHGNRLSFRAHDGWVEASLTLSEPLVIQRTLEAVY